MRTQIVMGLVAGFGLAGCVGDPPPDPTKAPVEIVVADCALNRPSVQAGRHEFSLVGDASATAMVTAPDGTEAFRLEAAAAPASPAYDLAQGEWTIECHHGEVRTGSATLRVDPAD